jgi:hypothetical protein
MYENSENPEAREITAIDMINMFWLTTEEKSKFTSGGITIQIDRQKYTYDVFGEDGMPDMDFRSKHTGREFFVQYDPADMNNVWLCTEDKNGLCKIAQAAPYFTIHRAIQEQAGGEIAFVRAIDEMNKTARVRRQVEAAVLENAHGIAPEQHGLVTPRLAGISIKEYERLCDTLYNGENDNAVNAGSIKFTVSVLLDEMNIDFVIKE